MVSVATTDRGSRSVVTIAALAAFTVTLDIAWFDASIAQLQALVPLGSLATTFSLAAYIMAGAVAVMAGGRLVDGYGWRRVMQGASLAVAANVVLNAATIDPAMTIAGRALGGAGGSLLIVAGLAAVAREFPDARRTRPYASVGIAAAAAYLVVPAVGGYLIEQPYWRVTPLIVGVPLAVLVVLLARTTHGADADGHRRLDLAGLVLATLAMCGAVGGATLITHDGPDPAALSTLAAAGCLMLIFVAVEHRRGLRRDRPPVIDVRLFRNPTFAAAVASSALGGVGLGTVYLVIVQLGQDVDGLSPFETQLALIPAVVATITADAISPRIDSRIGTGRTVSLGLVVACLGYVLLMSSTAAVRFSAFAAVTIVAFGTELTLAPTNRAVVAPASRGTEATAVSTAKTVYKISAVISLAVVSGIFFARYDTMVSADLPLAVGGTGAITTPAEAAEASQDDVAVRAASVSAFLDAQRSAFVIPLVAAAAGALIAWRWIKTGLPTPSRPRPPGGRSSRLRS